MRIAFIFLLPLFLFSCHSSRVCPDGCADIIFTNGDIHTLDEKGTIATHLACKNGKILSLGKKEILSAYKGPETRIIPLSGQFVMPGFIEGHGHFVGLGKSLINVNLLGTRSWEEVLDRVKEKVDQAQAGQWIEGRGWHQEKWDSLPSPQVEGYPLHYALSKIAPENPLILYHASGHSLFANAAAMRASGITSESPDPFGGKIIRDSKGEPIGVFEERAMAAIRLSHQEYLNDLSPEFREAEFRRSVKLASEECLQKGITSFQDAGSPFEHLQLLELLAGQNLLPLRLWVMIRERRPDLDDRLDRYPMASPFLTVKALKTEVDGALGAHGAWLLRPYADKPGFRGQNTTPVEDIRAISAMAEKRNMQLCVHAIGDKANQTVLDLMATVRISGTADGE